ncbi:MAG: hypothetical protein M0Z53_05925 [Thermaerobacter sp.]|nr:hypothetical protein [Thermaerobacter sp.]
MAHLTPEQLLHAAGPGRPVPDHVRQCLSCQTQLDDLATLLSAVAPAPEPPSLTAGQLLSRWAERSPRRAAKSWLVAIPLTLALLGIFMPQPPPVPRQALAATVSLPFAQPHASVRWQRGLSYGRLTLTNLPAMPGRVLTFWFIRNGSHVPVAWIPLNHVQRRLVLWFQVPAPDSSYQAIGATLEPAPYRLAPSGPRVFFAPLTSSASKPSPARG